MKDLICEICHKKGFKDARGLQGHIRIVHGTTGEKVDGYDGKLKEMRKNIIEHIFTLQGRFVELDERKAEVLKRFPKVSLFTSWFDGDDKEASRNMRNEIVEAIRIEQKEIREHVSELRRQIGLNHTKESTKEDEIDIDDV